MIRNSLRLLSLGATLALTLSVFSNVALADQESPCDAAQANFISTGHDFVTGNEISSETTAELKIQLAWLKANQSEECSSVVLKNMEGLISEIVASNSSDSAKS